MWCSSIRAWICLLYFICILLMTDIFSSKIQLFAFKCRMSWYFRLNYMHFVTKQNSHSRLKNKDIENVCARQKDNTRSQTNRRSFSFLADCLPCSDMQEHRKSRNHNFLWGEIWGKCGKRKHTQQSLPRPPKLWYASSQQQH